MNGDTLAAWHQLSSAFLKVTGKVLKSKSVNINSVPLRDEVKAVARQYMQEARHFLTRPGFETELALFDQHFQRLYELADGRNAASSYNWRIGSLRKTLPKVTSRLEMQAAPVAANAPQGIEASIIDTLMTLIPTAGLSYRQAISDLADDNRISFRGPATELREVLREVLDHLAPDAEVTKTPGFQLEKEQKKPTMKQKVRFILRARGQGSNATAASEKAAETVDLMVGGIARSIYDLGSVVTHVAGERQTVVQLKRYVEVVLSHLLEL